MTSMISCVGASRAVASGALDAFGVVGLRQFAHRRVDGDRECGAVRHRRPQARHAARLLNDPRTDRDDQAGLLGERHEVDRLHEAARRVPPAHERLEADDRAGRQRHDRLEVQLELVLDQGGAQLGFEGEAMTGHLSHLRLEVLDEVLARLLRPIHRQVGVADDLVSSRVEAFDAGAGDADADPESELAALDDQWLAHCRHDAQCDVSGSIVGVIAGEEHGELVAAESARRCPRHV